jgi:hypothetical protein
MARCTKCSAELIGSAKFCATCGTAVPAGPAIDFAPVSQVNPFAATASPTSKNPISVAPPADSVAISGLDAPPTQESGAPQGKPDSAPSGGDSPLVSPLAVSGALSERGAFHQAVAAAKRLSLTPPAAPAKAKKPGTQLMPNSPGHPSERPAPSKAQMKTVAMQNAPKPKIPSAPNSAAQPSQPAMPSQPQPPYAPAAPYAQQQPPSGSWGWGTPQPAPTYGQQPGVYAPGTRVQVTWSNGQRYPATVSQMSGTQCLVVFPDGQQHWVDKMYLTPG